MISSLSKVLTILLLNSSPAIVVGTDVMLAEREDYLTQSPGFGGRDAYDFLTSYVPSSFGDSLAELQFYWRIYNTPEYDVALTKVTDDALKRWTGRDDPV